MAGLSAKKVSRGRAGGLPPTRSALSPRRPTQPGSPAGATGGGPSRPPRRPAPKPRGRRAGPRLSRRRRGERPERLIEQRARVGSRRDALGEVVGDVEALAQAV